MILYPTAIGYRVWWQDQYEHPGSDRRGRRQYHDFRTKGAAAQFAQAMRDAFPHARVHMHTKCVVTSRREMRFLRRPRSTAAGNSVQGGAR